MSAWKIHLVWGVLAVVIAAAWGQHVASRKEREFEAERTAARLNRRAPSTSAPVPTSEPAPLPASSDAPAESSPLSDPEAGPAKPKVPAQKRELLSPEEIRTLLQSSDKGDLQRALRAIEMIEDRARKSRSSRNALAQCLTGAYPRTGARPASKVGRSRSGGLMAKTLLSDPDEGSASRAARYLGDVGGPPAMTALQQAARSGTLTCRSPPASRWASSGNSGPRQAILSQIARMLENPDGAVREDAVSLPGRPAVSGPRCRS